MQEIEGAPPSYYEETPPPITARQVDLAVTSYEREVSISGRAQPAELSAYVQSAARPVLTEETGCVGGILVASFFQLADAAIYCRYYECKENGYAVVTGAISTFMCLFFFALCCFKVAAVEVYNKFLPIFLMLWWGVGTAKVTFVGGFMYTLNGVFACWGATFLSLYYFQITLSRFKFLGEHITQVFVGDRKKKVLMQIMVFSFCEAASAVIPEDHCSWWWYRPKRSSEETWERCAGFISGSFAALYFLKGVCDPGSSGQSDLLKYFSWVLTPWWLACVGVVNYYDCWTINLYICSWGACVCSCYLVYLTTVVPRESSI